MITENNKIFLAKCGTLEHLHALKDQPHWYVRYTVADNPNVPHEILHHLKDDKESNVRRVIAENPNTPIEILHHLKNDSNLYVRYALVDNPTYKKFLESQK